MELSENVAESQSINKPLVGDSVADKSFDKTENVIDKAIPATTENGNHNASDKSEPINCAELSNGSLTTKIEQKHSEFQNEEESNIKTILAEQMPIVAGTIPDSNAPPVHDSPPTDPNILPAYVINALDAIATKNNFTSFTITVEAGSAKNDGVVGLIIRVIISDTTTPKQMVLIVKLPPKGDTNQAFCLPLFKREVMAYNDLMPAFEEFQRQRGLRPGVNGFFAYPQCHFAIYDESNGEAAIIMDDIRHQGYFMENRFKPVKYDIAKSVMQQLGQFHAISLAMKDQEPDNFARFKEYNDNFSDAYDGDSIATWTDFYVEKAIGSLEAYEQKIKEKLLIFGPKMVDELKRCNNGELSEPHSVLLHGDCHLNNIMFRLEGGIPKHVILFDWQITRYASPVIDVLYFIFMSSDKPLRDQHFDHLIQAYHNSLREQLELLGSDVNVLFPFTALIRQIKQFGACVLGICLSAIPMLCMDQKDIPTLDDWSDKLKDATPEDCGKLHTQLSVKSENEYKIRMSDVLRDMHRKGLF